MPNIDSLRAAVILPTYNERENLAAMVAAIQALPTPIHIIIVDDNSPDGSGAIADELAARSPVVEVIHRSDKLGLGTAYAAGFRQAIAGGNDLILTMDADFSHDPGYLPAILAASKHYDLVIGSRYVPKGGVYNWPWHRQALSWGANAIVHLLLGLHARDCTAGFRCYRRRVLEQVDPASIRANGYSYLIEMLFCCERAGFSVGEIPIIFADRRLGRSKISQNEIFKAGRTVLRLAFRRLSDRGQRVAALLASDRPRTESTYGRSGKIALRASYPGGIPVQTRNQGSSASLIELALIVVLIAIIIMAILLIVGDDLRLWVVNTVGGIFGVK